MIKHLKDLDNMFKAIENMQVQEARKSKINTIIDEDGEPMDVQSFEKDAKNYSAAIIRYDYDSHAKDTVDRLYIKYKPFLNG